MDLRGRWRKERLHEGMKLDNEVRPCSAATDKPIHHASETLRRLVRRLGEIPSTDTRLPFYAECRGGRACDFAASE